MHHLLRKQALVLWIVMACTIAVQAQDKELYRADHDDLRYYFGMTLGYNTSFLSTQKNYKFMQDDSILSVQSGTSGGIALGLLGTLKLNDFFELRFNPQLILGSAKYFTYVTNYPVREEKKTLPSTIVSFPLHLKFTSDRIGNFRTYILGGGRLDVDLASNSAARNAEDLVKLKKYDWGLEGGVGFNFYLPFVTVSPELKFSYGLTNIHSRDPSLKYSSIFDRIQSRMVIFSLHLED